MHRVIENYIRMCYDGYKLGWHERNGGNLTYRMKPEEVEGCRNLFTQDRHLDLPIDASALAGEHFITSGTTRFSGAWRTMRSRPASCPAICSTTSPDAQSQMADAV